MNEQNIQEIEKLLASINIASKEHFEIMARLRNMIFSENSDATERVMYGGIMFCINDEDFGGIFSSKNHVSFEFSNGYRLEDTNKLLEGSGKNRRHLKLTSLADIDNKRVKYYVLQALEFAK